MEIKAYSRQTGPICALSPWPCIWRSKHFGNFPYLPAAGLPMGISTNSIGHMVSLQVRQDQYYNGCTYALGSIQFM